MKEAVINSESGLIEVTLDCEIDHHAAKKIRESVDSALVYHRPRELVLDFSCVSFMDSSGIGLIIGRAEKAADVGATVSIKGLNGNLRKLVRMSGITKLKGLKIID